MSIVLVTGASSGFGAAIARSFVARGARVILAARRTDRLDALGRELGASTLAWPLDVCDDVRVARLVDELPAEWRDIDVLVNNAGLALGLEPADAASLTDWDTMIATNTRALVHVTRAVLPGMVARRRGHIVNISSIAGTYAYAGGNVYGATKAFVTQFSQNLRADLLGKGVRVTNIEPGLADTEFSLVRFHGDAERAAAPYVGADPLTAADVAEAVVWACSLPPHVDITRLEMMPTSQASAGLAVFRRS